MNKLKEWDKKVNQAWERVGRGRKTLLYLTLCFLLSLGIWVRLGCPLPTMEMELRRWERTHLLKEESQIVFSAKADERLDLEEDAFVRFSKNVVIGTAPGRAVIGAGAMGAQFSSFSLGEGPFVTLFPGILSMDSYLSGQPYVRGVQALAFQIPEEAASGELTILARSGIEISLTGRGWRLGEGVWLFLPSTMVSNWSMSGNAPYTLTLYRADGSLLLEHSGTLGE